LNYDDREMNNFQSPEKDKVRLIHRRGEVANRISALAFTFVERLVGSIDNIFRISRIVWIAGYADTQR